MTANDWILPWFILMRIMYISLKDPLLFMIRDLTISNRNVKHLESSDAAVSQFLIRYLAVWPGP